MLNAKGRLQDGDRDNKVRSENKVLFPIDAETVRAELFTQNVERAWHIFGPLVNDVEVRVGLNETARRSSDGS